MQDLLFIARFIFGTPLIFAGAFVTTIGKALIRAGAWCLDIDVSEFDKQ